LNAVDPAPLRTKIRHSLDLPQTFTAPAMAACENHGVKA
jgi:hypothetical protein